MATQAGGLTRFTDYFRWAFADNSWPHNLVELDGPWPVTITQLTAPPGEMRRPRTAFHDLFISLKTLELWEHTGGRRRRYQFRRGVVSFTAANTNWHISWTGKLDGFGFLFDDAILRRAYGADASDVQFRLALSDQAPALGFLGIEIATQVFAGFPDGREHVNGLLGSFFGLAARRYAATAEREALKLSRHHPQVQRALTFIEENLGGHFALGEVCAAADVSIAHLNRIFQAELGISVWQYVKARRLQRGQELLRQTALPISTVAARCGFGSTAHFTNAFRTRYGVPPSQLRTSTS